MPFPGHQVSLECIRVVIADDQIAVRSGLRYFLLAFDDLELVGEANNDKETLELCARVRPNVVLMDLRLPGMQSFDTIQETRTIRTAEEKSIGSGSNERDAEIGGIVNPVSQIVQHKQWFTTGKRNRLYTSSGTAL